VPLSINTTTSGDNPTTGFTVLLFLLSSLVVIDTASTMPSNLADHEGSINGVNELRAQNCYSEERGKRLRSEGEEQFVDISLSDTFESFQEAP